MAHSNDSQPPAAVLDELYRLVGEDGFARLVAAFYAQVREDEILAPMYPADDWEGAEQRLRDFLIFRCGGPPRYIHERGHPRLGMRHMRFLIDEPARNRWVELMQNAIDQADLPPQARRPLEFFFAHTATFLINQRQAGL